METEEKKHSEKGEHNTEQAIMEAAEYEFLEKGFDGAKTTAIASRAGVTHAMLHYYYRTKAKLFEIVLNRKMSQMFGSFWRVFDREGTFLERFEALIGLHFDMINANPKLPIFILSEMSKKTGIKSFFIEHFPPHVAKTFERLSQEIKAEVEAGRIKPIMAEDLIYNMVVLNVGVALGRPLISHVCSMRGEDFDQYMEHRKQENIKIIINSLKP